MSHHLDSELARQDPRLDISDAYVFRGTMGTAFVVDVNPVSGPGGFHPEGGYELKIDTDGDAVENITYRFTFGETGSDGRQAWHLSRIDGDAATDPLAGAANRCWTVRPTPRAATPRRLRPATGSARGSARLPTPSGSRARS
ncbi:DUF4331 family protein [Yinghuangia sp. YIM S10712]|uniref:DUF4331 family protein n=1 Tax=Yinghuangia sp. YIM S10712 TaxID=3436930 RepID=UPI003F53A052